MINYQEDSLDITLKDSSLGAEFYLGTPLIVFDNNSFYNVNYEHEMLHFVNELSLYPHILINNVILNSLFLIVLANFGSGTDKINRKNGKLDSSNCGKYFNQYHSKLNEIFQEHFITSPKEDQKTNERDKTRNSDFRADLVFEHNALFFYIGKVAYIKNEDQTSDPLSYSQNKEGCLARSPEEMNREYMNWIKTFTDGDIVHKRALEIVKLTNQVNRKLNEKALTKIEWRIDGKAFDTPFNILNYSNMTNYIKEIPAVITPPAPVDAFFKPHKFIKANSQDWDIEATRAQAIENYAIWTKRLEELKDILVSEVKKHDIQSDYIIEIAIEHPMQNIIRTHKALLSMVYDPKIVKNFLDDSLFCRELWQKVGKDISFYGDVDDSERQTVTEKSKEIKSTFEKIPVNMFEIPPTVIRRNQSLKVDLSSIFDEDVEGSEKWLEFFIFHRLTRSSEKIFLLEQHRCLLEDLTCPLKEFRYKGQKLSKCPYKEENFNSNCSITSWEDINAKLKDEKDCPFWRILRTELQVSTS